MVRSSAGSTTCVRPRHSVRSWARRTGPDSPRRRSGLPSSRVRAAAGPRPPCGGTRPNHRARDPMVAHGPVRRSRRPGCPRAATAHQPAHVPQRIQQPAPARRRPGPTSAPRPPVHLLPSRSVAPARPPAPALRPPPDPNRASHHRTARVDDVAPASRWVLRARPPQSPAGTATRPVGSSQPRSDTVRRQTAPRRPTGVLPRRRRVPPGMVGVRRQRKRPPSGVLPRRPTVSPGMVGMWCRTRQPRHRRAGGPLPRTRRGGLPERKPRMFRAPGPTARTRQPARAGEADRSARPTGYARPAVLLTRPIPRSAPWVNRRPLPARRCPGTARRPPGTVRRPTVRVPGPSRTGTVPSDGRGPAAPAARPVGRLSLSPVRTLGRLALRDRIRPPGRPPSGHARPPPRPEPVASPPHPARAPFVRVARTVRSLHGGPTPVRCRALRPRGGPARRCLLPGPPRPALPGPVLGPPRPALPGPVPGRAVHVGRRPHPVPSGPVPRRLVRTRLPGRPGPPAPVPVRTRDHRVARCRHTGSRAAPRPRVPRLRRWTERRHRAGQTSSRWTPPLRTEPARIRAGMRSGGYGQEPWYWSASWCSVSSRSSSGCKR